MRQVRVTERITRCSRNVRTAWSGSGHGRRRPRTGGGRSATGPGNHHRDLAPAHRQRPLPRARRHLPRPARPRTHHPPRDHRPQPARLHRHPQTRGRTLPDRQGQTPGGPSRPPGTNPAHTHPEQVLFTRQIGRDAGGIIPDEFGAQMRVAIKSLRNLEAAGASLDTVVKTTVFLTRQEDFTEINDIYAKYFNEPWPARSTVVAGMVRPELLFEIEAIAHRRRS
ncbi:RidA family protein [Streptomyces sp. NPDC002845]